MQRHRSEEKISPDEASNCGFISLGVSRKQVADCLQSFIENQAVRQRLSGEVKEAFESKLLTTPRWQQLFQERTTQQINSDALRKKFKASFPEWRPRQKESLDTQESKLLELLHDDKPENDLKLKEFLEQRTKLFLAEDAISSYCQTSEALGAYIDGIRGYLRLGDTSALIYAENNNLSTNDEEKRAPIGRASKRQRTAPPGPTLFAPLSGDPQPFAAPVAQQASIEEQNCANILRQY